MSAAGSPPGGRLLCAFLVLSAPDQRISFPVYQSDDSLGENSNEKYVSWIAYFIPSPCVPLNKEDVGRCQLVCAILQD